MLYKSCDILIRRALLMLPDYSFKKDVSIAIKDGIILDIGSSLEDKYLAAEIIDGCCKLAMPGLIDGHTHLSQQLLRGLITDEYPIIYRRFNLPHESKLSAEDIVLSVQLGCIEMIHAGITSFADAGSTHMDTFISTLLPSGLRATITRGTSDKGNDLPRNMIESTKEGIQKSEQFYNDYHGLGDGRLQVWFQYRSLATCSENLIVGLSEMAKEYGTGIHTHVSEYSESVLYTLNRYKMREIEYLHHLGVLGENLLAAHCLLISENEIGLLAESGTNVVHCPRSNLGKVVSKTPTLLNRGVSVGMGTDGTAHSGLNLFREMTAFRHSQIVCNGVPYLDFNVVNSQQLLEMATMGSARALMQGDSLGSLMVGKKADIILIDLLRPHILPTKNLLNTLTETVDCGDVSDMIVDGRIIMRNRTILTLDEEKIMFQAKQVNKSISINIE